ncbi:hypothetical protein SAMD00019534_035720, partial [Acytostelium subglobosum LB1]|uniref:hypothetical protein n=1 Tax=Acytostelium subglobosum LB1 TaxID=1410327 RepID=UPI0006452249
RHHNKVIAVQQYQQQTSSPTSTHTYVSNINLNDPLVFYNNKKQTNKQILYNYKVSTLFNIKHIKTYYYLFIIHIISIDKI